MLVWSRSGRALAWAILGLLVAIVYGLPLGIIAKGPDGGGRITASFDAEAFLRDLETLVGPLLMRDRGSGTQDLDDPQRGE